MKIHRQLTAAAFLFISMAIMAQVPFSKKEVKEKMKQVADWQISNPNTAHEHHDLATPSAVVPCRRYNRFPIIH